MKKLLVLGGGSVRNKAWGEACAEYFKGQFDVTFFIHYSHWETEEKNINFEIELEKISETIRGADSDGEWYVFAKSIGSILTLKAVKAEIITPSKCVFFGMPLNLVADNVMKNDWTLLSDFSVDAIAFHNDNDPTADFAFTAKKLQNMAQKVTLVPLHGDTHDYLNFSDYESEINSFLKL